MKQSENFIEKIYGAIVETVYSMIEKSLLLSPLAPMTWTAVAIIGAAESNLAMQIGGVTGAIALAAIGIMSGGTIANAHVKEEKAPSAAKWGIFVYVTGETAVQAIMFQEWSHILTGAILTLVSAFVYWLRPVYQAAQRTQKLGEMQEEADATAMAESASAKQHLEMQTKQLEIEAQRAAIEAQQAETAVKLNESEAKLAESRAQQAEKEAKRVATQIKQEAIAAKQRATRMKQEESLSQTNETERNILATLAQQTATQAQLAKKLNVSPATISRSVKGLRDKGLVTGNGTLATAVTEAMLS